MLLALLLATTPPLQVEATRFQLENGLRVVVSPQHKVPGVAVDLWYDVGSRDEKPGRTGFAHLFEHLMFMGARHVPYPQFDTLMEAHGGRNNAQTGNDTTHYFESGPSNLLEMFLWMEADRMATLARVMTLEKLDTQRKVVLNERRQSYENRPYGKADLALSEALFPDGHPYSWPVIGSAKDVEAAQLDDVVGFFDHWYVPSNAILTIVGDVDAEQARALVQKYLGWIRSPPRPAHPEYPEVKLQAEKKVRMTDQVELPKVILAWPSPKATTQLDANFDVLAYVLGHGKASRLYERLVHQLQLASEVTAMQDSMDLQSVFSIEIMGRPGVTPEALEKAADAELSKLLAEGPTQQEVDAARLVIITQDARALEGLLSRAELLNLLERDYGDATALQKDLGRYDAVTPASARDAARAFLTPGRVVIEVLPAEGGDR